MPTSKPATPQYIEVTQYHGVALALLSTVKECENNEKSAAEARQFENRKKPFQFYTALLTI